MPHGNHRGNHEKPNHIEKQTIRPGRMTMTPGSHVGAGGTVVVSKRTSTKPYVLPTDKYVNPGGKKIV